jgi:hypothetical protein
VSKDPTRLSEGTDELASSIAGLRTESPSDARLAAIAARLASAGVPIGDGDAPASTRVPKRARLTLARLKHVIDSGVLAVVLALVVGAGVVTAAFLVRSADEIAPSTRPEGPVPTVATATAQDAHSVPTAAPPATTPSGDSLKAHADHDRSTRPTTPGVADAAPSGVASTPSDVAPPPSAPPPTTATQPSAVARHVGLAATSSAPSSRASTSHALPAAPGTATGAPLAAGAPVLNEVELLKQARSALAADPLQAFALTEQCRSRYPDGSFVQEREYIAIVALARLGRVEEARSRASLFRMHYKNSAYLPRLGALLGEP